MNFRGQFLCHLPWQERHIGITLSTVVVVVCWCCCLLWKRVNICLYIPHTLMDFNQTWVIGATWGPSFVDEVKGHISGSKVTYQDKRWSCKIGWKCKIGLNWKVEVRLEPNLVMDITRESSFVNEVKGHIPRSKVIWGQIVR